MIQSDQPTCFPDSVIVKVSSKADGTVLNRSTTVFVPESIQNRRAFCQTNGLSYDEVVYQRIAYGVDQTYTKVTEVDEESTSKHISEVKADVLFTRHQNIGLFLPVADCVATVIYDPVKQSLALLHLGRHSTLTDLTEQTLAVFAKHGSAMKDLLVWMSPSAQKESYKLDYFEQEYDPAWADYLTKNDGAYYIDMQGYNRAKYIRLGIPTQNIHISKADTVKDNNYFSHSAGDTNGRFAVVAMMR